MMHATVKVILVLIFALTIVLGETAQGETQGQSEKLLIQVYYETKCPDSMRFIRDQLEPSMRRSGRHEHTIVQLIPFGKAFTYKDPNTQELVASCQHGEPECEDNALHGCILETQEAWLAFDVISCMMRYFTTELESCATQFNMNLEPVKQCRANRTTAQILQKYESLTNKIDLTFVPSIGINGLFEPSEQNKLLYRFDDTFCKEYQTKIGKTLDNCL